MKLPVISILCVIAMMGGCAEKDKGLGEPDRIAASSMTSKTIGVYDSRSVAIAFCGNPEHEANNAAELASLAKAKTAGDKAEIKRADAAVWESRKQMHRQGFGTAAVDDILVLYPNGTEALKKKHNLSALVSKWDKQTLKSYAGAKQIDVTEELVDILKPNARQRKSALQIQEHKPITNFQLEILFKQHGH